MFEQAVHFQGFVSKVQVRVLFQTNAFFWLEFAKA